MKNILFLDVDGVLNSTVWFMENHKNLYKYEDKIPFYRVVKRALKKLVKSNKIDKYEFYKKQISLAKISLINKLCEETNTVVVITASMRSNNTLEELREIFKQCGGTFEIIGKTQEDDCGVRGVEIQNWLKHNIEYLTDKPWQKFHNYAIVDDGQDMLLSQAHHFFHVDGYFGLTPNITENIKNYFSSFNN